MRLWPLSYKSKKSSANLKVAYRQLMAKFRIALDRQGAFIYGHAMIYLDCVQIGSDEGRRKMTANVFIKLGRQLEELDAERTEILKKIRAATNAKEKLDKEVPAKRAAHRKARPGKAKARKRQIGLKDAILEVFSKGGELTIADIKTRLKAKKFSTKNLANTLSKYAKEGILKNVRRGVYRKAAEAKPNKPAVKAPAAAKPAPKAAPIKRATEATSPKKG